MATEKRRAYVREDPVAKVTKELDKKMQEVTNAVWNGLDHTGEAIAWGVQNPIEAVKEIGEFAEDTATAAWDRLRQDYGNATQLYNQITKLIDTPCEDRWDILIETALPAASGSLYLIFTPSPAEILEEYLQPYSTKSGRRRYKGDDPDKRRYSKSGRRRRSWPRIPDPDGMIAAMIPGGHAIRGRDIGNGEKWLFKGIDITDRVAWNVLLYEATSQGIAHWSTGLKEARFCSRPHAVIGIWSDSPGVNVENSFDPTDSNYSPEKLKGLDERNGALVVVDGLGNQVEATGLELSIKVQGKAPEEGPDGQSTGGVAELYRNGIQIKRWEGEPQENLQAGEEYTATLSAAAGPEVIWDKLVIYTSPEMTGAPEVASFDCAIFDHQNF